jgi:hypothetical protein
MILLQGLQGLFIALDGGLELADVLCATLTKGRLGLAIALLTLFRGRIDLREVSLSVGSKGRLGIKIEAHVRTDEKRADIGRR